MIATLSGTTRQLEAGLAAEQAARRRAEADAAGRERAAQESGAALEEICAELRVVQVMAVPVCWKGLTFTMEQGASVGRERRAGSGNGAAGSCAELRAIQDDGGNSMVTSILSTCCLGLGTTVM